MGLEAGTVLDGKYEIEGRLGEGGMGVVYRARQRALGRSVAIKVLSLGASSRSGAVERFRREAYAVAQLRHPNIVTIHDFGDVPDVGSYIVLELLEGVSLEAELARVGRLGPNRALAIVRDVCAALGAAHAAGIVHRDLKPSNIFLEQMDGRTTAKVLDFGIAKLNVLDAIGPNPVTAAGAIVGTPIYMSPEQCEGRELDARSDLYSLGCVLYEMLTGRPPFPASTFFAAIRMHTSKPVEPPSRLVADIPAGVDEVVLRLLAKQADNRFASAGDVMRALAGDAELGAPLGGAPTAVVNPTPVEDDRRTMTHSDADLTRAIPPNNLASAITSFVGRTSELAELTSALHDVRLLTLTGPGGVGKSRLALELARTALEWREDGVWFVDLSGTMDPALVPNALATALRILEEPGRPLLETILASFAHKRAVVVLDECEHLVDAIAPLAASLVRECRELRVVATSREVLGITGEVVWPVQPLGVPVGAEDATSSDAVQLFAERVRLRDRSFVVDERNASIVAEICRRLDGIPLALELAAARASVLSLEQILSKLDDRFRLLTSGERTSSPRRQTLKATLDWSYALLSEDERRLFERLAVFAGGFTLEAVEAVAPDDARAAVLDVLQRLVDKSLVGVDRRRGEVRYRLLETIREYALERLREHGEEPIACERHTAFFEAFIRRAREGIDGPDQTRWLDRVHADLDNIRSVFRRAAAKADWATVARLGHGLFLFWTIRAHWSEGFDTLSPAIESGAEIPPDVLGGAYYTLGALKMRMAEFSTAERYLERSLEIRRALGDTVLAAATMRMFGTLLLRKGELDRAMPLLEECLDVYREEGDELHMAWALSGLGLVAMDLSDWDLAHERMEASLELSRRSGGARHAASALHNLGEIMYRKGEYDRAEAFADECRMLATELDDRQLVGFNVVLLANIAARRGDLDRAEERYSDALTSSRAIKDMLVVAYALEGSADVAALRGDGRRALELLDEAAAVRAAGGFVLNASERAEIVACRTRAEASLGESPS